MKKKNTGIISSIFIVSSFFLCGCSLAEKVPGHDLFKADRYENIIQSLNEQASLQASNSQSNWSTMTAEEAIKYAQESGLYSESELKMLKLEYKLDNNGLSQPEYMELASIYDELGFIKNERDILEQCYRLYGDEQVLVVLNDLSVNTVEETADINELVDRMRDNMADSDSISEVIHEMEGDEWLTVLMSRINTGRRSYYTARNGFIDFSISVSNNKTGDCEGVVKYLANGSMGDVTGVIIARSNNVIKVYEEINGDSSDINKIGDLSATKDFVMWSFDMYTGTVKCEKGTLKDGLFTGTYSVAIHELATVDTDMGPYSAFDLFNNRENFAYDTYAGEFDDSGATILDQPSEGNIKALADLAGAETSIVYAYNEDKSKCLYKGVTGTEKEAGFSFGTGELTLPDSVSSKYYEVKNKDAYSLSKVAKDNNSPKYVSVDNIKVRIYDGNLQVFNGITWVNMGSVQEMAEADPFEEFKNNSGSSESGDENGDLVLQVANNNLASNVGAIKNEQSQTTQNKPTTTTKPGTTTTKPAASKPSQPATSQTPTGNGGGNSSQPSTQPSTPSTPSNNPTPSTPTPDPTPTPQPDPTPTPTPDPTPTPEPSPTPGAVGDDGGNDADIGYDPGIDDDDGFSIDID